MKHPFIKLAAKVISFSVKATVAIASVNFVYDVIEKSKRRKDRRVGEYYDWKYGSIFYTVRGHGSPVLLIHGMKPSDSGKDLDFLVRKLAPEHTVYNIDLLGFGLSEKPWITYTNYLYVLLIRDFIKDVIGEETDIYACAESCLIALQTNKVFPENIGHLTINNPCYRESLSIPKEIAMRIKSVVEFPLYGTFLYNLYSTIVRNPLDKDGRHVFLSRLAGQITSDISTHSELITSNVTVHEAPKKASLDDLYA